MRSPSSWRRFLSELKRRNVYRVAVAYAAVAFVGFQAATLLIPRTVLPSWADELLLAFMIAGFPVAVVVAWAFELTPEGIRRTSAAVAGRAEEARAVPGGGRGNGRPAVKALVGLGVAAALVTGTWHLVGGGGETPPEPRAGERSIAVLPFENMGGTESEQFTRGVHDGLLTRLFNVSGLKVISRTSVMQFEDTDLPLPAIAESLGVEWVMEGGVQKVGDRIQVNAQLIDARTDTHAWAEQYRRELGAENLFAIQSEITRRIAGSLEARLTPEEEARIDRRPTDDLEAYRFYVRGRNLLGRRTAESIREAVGWFERALREDSAYALAWAGLADARVLYVAWSDQDFVEGMRAALPEARAAARRARELDPTLAEAWTALGAIHVYETTAGLARGNGPAALEALRRAVELKPGYAHAQQWLGELYLRLGRPEQGLEHASLAVELNPDHTAARQVLIWALLARGEDEEAWRRFDRSPHEFGGLFENLVLYHAGRWEELERLAEENLEGPAGPGTLWWNAPLARIALLRGDTAAARKHLAELRRGGPTFPLGFVHAALGDADAAFGIWRDLELWSGGSLPVRYFYPDVLDPLRDDPRYREMIREINVAWGLNPDGSLPGETRG